MDDIAVISYRHFNFLITRNPTNATMESYIRELRNHHVKLVVRVCEPTYDTGSLRNCGIDVMDLNIPDGTVPSEDILDRFFNILRKQYGENPDTCVAAHCVSGLGRAPVMVAVALIELGYTYEDAIELIREKRRGAINSKQIEYLSKYKPRDRLCAGHDKKKACAIQ